jgi:adenosylhomocysteine nucleosidase
MHILVTFAVEAEFAPWRRLRNLEEVKISDVTAFRGQIGRARVDFVLTGMGVENAFRVTETVLNEPYQFCVTAGLAGSLKEEHSVGNILVADAAQILGQSKIVTCGRNLVYAASRDGAKRVKMFLTVDHVVRSVEEKKQLAPFADAVEMESFGVLSAAAKRKCSAVAIRVISDSMRRDMPAIVDTAVDERGRVKIREVARYVARHPLQLPALVRLGRDSKTAAQALAHFLEAFVKRLSFETHGYPPSELQEIAAR